MKTLLITGAGRGLGKATAFAYHRAGWYVIATDVDGGLLSGFPDHDNMMTCLLDVTLKKSIEACVKKVKEKTSQIDVLISNAAVFDFYPITEAGSERLRRIFDVNVFGLANLTRYFLPLLITGNSRLIAISSESYKVPSPFQPYAVSKQALESLYRAIKTEMELKKIRCILLRPGAIQTQILDETILFALQDNRSYFNKEFTRFIQTVPKYIGKIISEEKAARVVLKAGTAKNPKSIYHFNHNPLVSLLSFLPSRIQMFIIRKSLSKK